MAEMPERIWAKAHGQRTTMTFAPDACMSTHLIGGWDAVPVVSATEYVRADDLAEAREALREFHRLGLVIDSAIRADQPEFAPEVAALLRQVRAALAKIGG